MFTVKDAHTDATRGLYVVFEGPDGSGKSTLARMFTEALRRIAGNREAVYEQAFPSKDGPCGQLIRKAFTREITLSEETIGYLMIADGHERCPLLYQQLEKGNTVVCDRHILVSAWAYQAEVYTHDEIIAIQQRQRFLEPDIVFVLDVPPEVAVQRIKDRHDLVNLIFEKDDDGYRTRLRHRYSGYAALNDHAIVIDATQPVDVLLNTCLEIVRRNFTDSAVAS